MSKKVQDQLKSNIPATLDNNKLINGYVEAVGEIFDEIRQEINYKQYELDYAKSKSATFDLVNANLGLQLSSFFKEDVVRRIIRDMPVIYSRMGTKSSLIWVLKTLGYKTFQIDEAWVPNPDLIRKGYFRNLTSNNEPERYNLSQNSYTDFVVGEEYVTPEGTFFRGYAYKDFEKKNEISGIPIYGETYKNYTSTSFENMVSKTPYYIIRIYEPPKFDEVITDVDPETGNPVELSLREQQEIITNAIRYLIKELQRSATTSVILVTGIVRLEEAIPELLDPLDFISTHTPFSFVDILSQFQDTLVNDGKIVKGANNYIVIGDDRRLIGGYHPYEATGEYSSSGVVGLNPAEIDIVDSMRGQNTTTTVIDPVAGSDHVHFLDYGASVLFTAPAGANNITVEKVRNYYRSAPTDRIFLATVDAGQTFSMSIPDSHAIILTFNDAFTGTLTISSTYT